MMQSRIINLLILQVKHSTSYCISPANDLSENRKLPIREQNRSPRNPAHLKLCTPIAYCRRRDESPVYRLLFISVSSKSVAALRVSPPRAQRQVIDTPKGHGYNRWLLETP